MDLGYAAAIHYFQPNVRRSDALDTQESTVNSLVEL